MVYSSKPRILGSRPPLLPPVDRFLKPSFIPIFFHGFSVRSLGLWMGRCGSLAGGVVGGVMGSSAVGLDCGEPLSSVKANEADSPLGLSRAPEVRLPMACTAPSDMFERL